MYKVSYGVVIAGGSSEVESSSKSEKSKMKTKNVVVVNLPEVDLDIFP